MNILSAKEFKPDDSGFYSKNLFKWLKKRPDYNRVYKASWNNISGYDPNSPVLMIGFKEKGKGGWFHGNSLRRICSGPIMDVQPFAFGHCEMRVDEWEDVTEQFIDDYRRIGVCAIHGDFSHRFEHITKKHKRCLNCGKEYFRKARRVTEHYWQESGAQ